LGSAMERTVHCVLEIHHYKSIFIEPPQHLALQAFPEYSLPRDSKYLPLCKILTSPFCQLSISYFISISIY
jgi:hypothetical protein